MWINVISRVARIVHPARPCPAVRRHDAVTVIRVDPGLLEINSVDRPSHAFVFDAVARVEVAITEEGDADDGALVHHQKRVGNAERDEVEGCPEAGGNVVHRDDF